MEPYKRGKDGGGYQISPSGVIPAPRVALGKLATAGPELSLLAGLQLLLDALASLGRKSLRGLRLQVFLTLMRSRA